MLWVLKKKSRRDNSFEHPKLMFKPMDKKILNGNFNLKVFLNWPYAEGRRVEQYFSYFSSKTCVVCTQKNSLD